MVFLFDTNINNVNALAEGARWFVTKNENHSPLDAQFYRQVQFAPVHRSTIMVIDNGAAPVAGRKRGRDWERYVIDNAAMRAGINAVTPGEAVLIVAHGDYITRSLTSHTGSVNVTQVTMDLVRDLLGLANPPGTIFIAACESGIVTGGASILSVVLNGVQLNNTTLGGYVGLASLYNVTNAWASGDAAYVLNANRYGQHIVGERKRPGVRARRGVRARVPAMVFHMGYDRAVTTTLNNGVYSNQFALIDVANLHEHIAGNAARNPATIADKADPVFRQNQIPAAIVRSLEQVT